MRQTIDLLYTLARVLAIFLLVAIAVLVLVQMGSRLFKIVVPGVDDFAAYCLAAASFLALAPTLRAGAHIRVTLMIRNFGPRLGRAFDVWCVLVGIFLSGYFAYYSVDFVWDSYRFNEVGHAMVATPLWIPRSFMALGLIILFIAFIDELVTIFRGGRLVSTERIHDESRLSETRNSD